MKRLDDIFYDLICKIFNDILSVFIKPDFEFDSVCDLDEEVIDYLINDYGVKGFIIDVDETIRFNMQNISLENEQWLNMVLKALKVVMLSNGVDHKMEEKFDELGIEYISFAFKPLRRGFLKACDKIDLSPEHVAVIGDDLFDDIYGGKRNNMTTIKVSSAKQKVKRK